MTLGSASELYKLLIAGSVFLPEKNSTAEGRVAKGQPPLPERFRVFEDLWRSVNRTAGQNLKRQIHVCMSIYFISCHFNTLTLSPELSTDTHILPIHTPYLIYYYLCSLCRSHHPPPHTLLSSKQNSK